MKAMKASTMPVNTRNNAVAVKVPIARNEQGLILEWNCKNQSVTRFDLKGKPVPFKNLEGAFQIPLQLSDREFLDGARFFGKIFGYRLLEHVIRTRNGIRVALVPE